jgi:LytR cell envelope-related transcriptional attenuator
VVGWFLPWAVIALVLGAAVWIAVGVGGRGLEATDASRPDTRGQQSPADGAGGAGETDDPDGGGDASKPAGKDDRSSREAGGQGEQSGEGDRASGGKGATSGERGDKAPGDRSVQLLTDGFPVQVLNASTSATADNAMAERLANLGYTVASVVSASQPYQTTTVFWSFPGAEKAATRLAQRFGWEAAPKPVNLSPEVAIHVVVGNDEI